MTAIPLLPLLLISLSPDARAASGTDAGVPSVAEVPADGERRDGANGDGDEPELSPPVALSPVQPVYPDAAKAAGRTGTVVVRLEIDDKGAVISAAVVTGIDPALDAAALDAARSTRFQPARERGRPIRSVMDWSLTFTLAPATPAAPTADPEAAPPTPPMPQPTGHLEGRVLARGSRRPVAAATVTVGVTAVADTDLRGRFAAEAPCGERAITVQAPGFEPTTVRRDPCRDTSALLIRLPPRLGGPAYETVIRPPTSIPSTTLRAEELTKTAGSLGDPFRAVESLPGVAAVAWPAPIYAVRGANPGNTGFLLDDLRVPALFHLLLGPSVIHPYFFEGLDFYPGGYPARYGRYVSGIVAAQTRQPATDAVHASVDVRLFDAGALVSAPFPDGNGAIAVAARYSYTAALVSLATKDVRLNYWDYQLRADRRLGTTRLTLLWFGSHDLLGTSQTATAPDELVLRFHRVSLRSATPVGRGLLSAAVSVGLDHSKAPLADRVALTIDARSVMPRLAFRWPTTYVDFEVGFDGEFQWISPRVPFRRPGLLDLAYERKARLMAGYLALPVRAGPNLLLTPAVRLDTYNVSGTTKADVGPRLSARLALDGERTWLTANGGRFTQAPSLPLAIPGADNFGLALYGLQTSWMGSLGVGTRRFAGLESTVTGYLQRYVLTDVRDPTISTFDPLATDFLTRRDAVAYGMEVLIRRPNSERLHGWLAYTLSRNLRALGGAVIAPSDWDQRHILNLVLGYRMGKYTVGGRAHLHTGRPTLIRNRTPQEFGRLPTYYQIDLRADRRIVFDAFTLEVYIELVNATFSQQTLALDSDYIGTQTMNRNVRIVLPSIGVHGEF